MEDGGFYFAIRGENGDVGARSAEDFVEEMRDGGFAGCPGNAD